MGLVLKPAGLAGWREALAELQRRVGELFGRPEPRRQVGLYLEGLLGPAERKNGWQLAEAIGDRRPWRTQRVLSHVLWDQDKARDLCRNYVVEHLGRRTAGPSRLWGSGSLGQAGGGIGFGLEQVAESGAELAVENGAADLEQEMGLG